MSRELIGILEQLFSARGLGKVRVGESMERVFELLGRPTDRGDIAETTIFRWHDLEIAFTADAVTLIQIEPERSRPIVLPVAMSEVQALLNMLVSIPFVPDQFAASASIVDIPNLTFDDQKTYGVFKWQIATDADDMVRNLSVT